MYFWKIQAFLAKNVQLLSKKNVKLVQNGVFCSFKRGFPSADERCAPQKIGDGHGFFAGLLDVGQVDETVGEGDFEVLLVVGYYAAHGNFGPAKLDFRAENFQVNGFAVFWLELRVGGRIGRQASDVIEDGSAVFAPIHATELFRDFRGRL